MTETEPKPFDEFKVSAGNDTFHVVCHDIQFHRTWRSGGLSKEEKPEFLTSIHGQAVCTDHDEVCVLGTGVRSKTFKLIVKSDQEVKESWNRLKSIELLVRELKNRERLRIRDMQHKHFDNSPPTASLFFAEGFVLECSIPPAVIDQLVSDLVAHYVNAVNIKISWVFPFIDNLSGALGFFQDGELRGYISDFTWSSPKLLANGEAET